MVTQCVRVSQATQRDVKQVLWKYRGCAVVTVILAFIFVLVSLISGRTDRNGAAASISAAAVRHEGKLPAVNAKDPHDHFEATDEFYVRELQSGVEPLPDFDLDEVDPETGKKKPVRCTPGLCDGGCHKCCSRYGWCGESPDHCYGPFTTDCRNRGKQKSGDKKLKNKLERSAVEKRKSQRAKLKVYQAPAGVETVPAMAGDPQPDVMARDPQSGLECIDVVVLAVPRKESNILRGLISSTIEMGKQAGSCLKPTVVAMRPAFPLMKPLVTDFPTLSVLHGKYEKQNLDITIERRRPWGAHPAVMAKQVMQQQRDIINMLEAWKPQCVDQFMLVEDDFVWCSKAKGAVASLQRVLALATAAGRETWSAVKFSHGLGGVLLQCRDIEAVQKHLETFMGAWPPDALVGEFLGLDCAEGSEYFQTRRYLSYRYNLLQHTAKLSTLQRDPAAMAGGAGLDVNGNELHPEATVKFKFPVCMEEFHLGPEGVSCSSLNLAAECFNEKSCFLGTASPIFARDKTGRCLMSQGPA